MYIKVYTDLTEGRENFDPYSIQLSIKDIINDVFVIPEWTDPTKTAPGHYEKTFDTTQDIIYVVTWKIISELGKDPFYKTEQIGPVAEIVEKSIRTSADYKGTFKAGTIATLFLQVTNFDGAPIGVESINITIYDEEGGTVTSKVPTTLGVGNFVFDWSIDADQEAGQYYIIWEYVVNDYTKTEKQTVNVSLVGEDSIYQGVTQIRRFVLETYLSCAQAIPIYYEQSNPSRDNKTFSFSFPRWNQSTGVKIYRNGALVNSGIDINYFKGTVTFDDVLTSYDVVTADYNFRWFDIENLNIFLEVAVQVLNTFPPHSGYNIVTIPDKFLPAVLYKAATDALRQLLLCLQFQEAQQVFGGPEGAQKAFSNVESLKKNFEEEWKLLFEQKKYGPYTGLTRAVVTPEYTLPGGRSRWFRYLFKSGV